MKNLNIEIKAQIDDPERIRRFLLERGAEFRGTDHQIDTYFTVARGRLKIRRGTIENCIVWYERPDNTGPKRCDYLIEKFPEEGTTLESIGHMLEASLGIRAVVDKQREIYFIGNVKFHIDDVAGLGSFFEIEAIGGEDMGEEELRRQCGDYLAALCITDSMLLRTSYCDMIERRNSD